MMETKIVTWTIGGSFAVATLLFIGKIIVAVRVGIEARIDAYRTWLLGDDGNVLKTLGGALWEFVKGGALGGS